MSEPQFNPMWLSTLDEVWSSLRSQHLKLIDAKVTLGIEYQSNSIPARNLLFVARWNGKSGAEKEAVRLWSDDVWKHGIEGLLKDLVDEVNSRFNED